MFFQIFAFCILILFYGCYFTKMLVQRKNGITTNQLGKNKTGIEKYVECTVKIFSIVILILEIYCILLNISYLPLPFCIFGAAISALGVIIFISAVITMRDNWRAGVCKTDKTSLVTNGIFSISRNPAFLGFYCVYIGILFMFFNWVLCAVSIFTIFAFHTQIIYVEEKFLSDTFKNEYLKYRNKTNRYLGIKR